MRIAFSTLLFISGAIIMVFSHQSCKTKEEPLPVVQFSFSSDTLSEGDTLTIINASQNSRGYFWELAGTSFTSSETSPRIPLTKSGVYELMLTCTNGDGKKSSGSKKFTVLPDTVYRLSNNSMKKWIVKSIIYSGNEMLTESCQKDDEFTVYHNDADTCTLTEGLNKCPGGTYIFELPATSQWRYNTKIKAFEFALIAFGSPINLSFETIELTSEVYRGNDKTNGVSIHLIAEP